MYFLIDEKNKIAFGYSAKAGCSHIKKIFWYLITNDANHKIHVKGEYNSMPKDYIDYTFIIILRNPYERIISGFLDKYKPNGQFRKFWKEDILSFEQFVNTLIKGEFKEVNKHHFTPQTTEKFREEYLLKSKTLHVYDLCNIDYDIIEKLYNKKIPTELIDFKGSHANDRQLVIPNDVSKVYSLDISCYLLYKVPIEKFFNEELTQKVTGFFINDLIFAKKFGIIYKRPNY
jgi:hypothetical protein